MSTPKPLLLFALNATRPFAERVSSLLETPLSPHEEREFEDGEHKARPLCSVRDSDVYVVQSLHGDDLASPNDKLCRLLFFIGALRDAGAGRITAFTPYLCYARKDRKTKERDPVITRYVAGLFESVGLDRIVTLDVHNLAAFENAFHRILAENFPATKILAHYFAQKFPSESLVVVSPDPGGIDRAGKLRQALERGTDVPVGMAYMEKSRSSGKVRGEALAGDVAGKTAIIIDDLISTGGTLVRAARACRDKGAERVVAAATHGLFVGGSPGLWDEPALEGVVVTDTVPATRVPERMLGSRLTVIDAAPVVSEAIRRMHFGDPLSPLREYLA